MSPHIPKAISIAPHFEALGFSAEFARQASHTYLKLANELHRACLASLQSALVKAAEKGPMADVDIQTMNHIWTTAYTKQTRIWADEAISRAHDALANEYTPLLEKYFEYNAYPSAADKAVLARKSMMTARQIEVWFQNHRNRARRDGRPIRKLTEDPLPLEISLKSLERKMPFFTIPEYERSLHNKAQPPQNSESSDEDDI
ncbi:hypothetical protein H0H81_001520, partial [Sphagnurus paluster]